MECLDQPRWLYLSNMTVAGVSGRLCRVHLTTGTSGKAHIMTPSRSGTSSTLRFVSCIPVGPSPQSTTDTVMVPLELGELHQVLLIVRNVY